MYNSTRIVLLSIYFLRFVCHLGRCILSTQGIQGLRAQWNWKSAANPLSSLSCPQSQKRSDWCSTNKWIIITGQTIHNHFKVCRVATGCRISMFICFRLCSSLQCTINSITSPTCCKSNANETCTTAVPIVGSAKQTSCRYERFKYPNYKRGWVLTTRTNR